MTTWNLKGHTHTKVNSSCCPLHPRTTPFPEEKSILGVICEVLLWADMNDATPLGAWGRSMMSLERAHTATNVKVPCIIQVGSYLATQQPATVQHPRVKAQVESHQATQQQRATAMRPPCKIQAASSTVPPFACITQHVQRKYTYIAPPVEFSRSFRTTSCGQVGRPGNTMNVKSFMIL